MIIFHPEPLTGFVNEKPSENIMISLPSGGVLLAENVDKNNLRVCGLISTDPLDFLNADWQPGSILKPEYIKK